MAIYRVGGPIFQVKFPRSWPIWNIELNTAKRRFFRETKQTYKYLTFARRGAIQRFRFQAFGFGISALIIGKPKGGTVKRTHFTTPWRTWVVNRPSEKWDAIWRHYRQLIDE